VTKRKRPLPLSYRTLGSNTADPAGCPASVPRGAQNPCSVVSESFVPVALSKAATPLFSVLSAWDGPPAPMVSRGMTVPGSIGPEKFRKREGVVGSGGETNSGGAGGAGGAKPYDPGTSTGGGASGKGTTSWKGAESGSSAPSVTTPSNGPSAKRNGCVIVTPASADALAAAMGGPAPEIGPARKVHDRNPAR
jgi:hypothetical protein